MSAAAHIRLLPDSVEVGSSLADIGPISPELALVDPELARAARALLPDRPTHVAPPPVVPMLAVSVAPAEAAEPTAGAPDLGIVAAPAAAAGTFASRHFMAGTLVGLLVAVLAVEVYLLLDPLRSSSTSESPTSTRALVAPTSTGPPNIAAPASRPLPAGASPSAKLPGTVATPAPRRPPTGPSQALTAPATVAPRRTATVLAWPPKAGAETYRVTLLQDGRRIFERTTGTARLPLPGRWRYAGKQHRFVPGTYRWIVTPLWHAGGAERPGAPIVDAVYVVP